MTTLRDLKPSTEVKDSPADRTYQMVYGYLDQAATAYSRVSNDVTVVADSLRSLVISDCTRFYEANQKVMESALSSSPRSSWVDFGRQLFLVREHGVAALDMRNKYLFNNLLFDSAMGFGCHSINLNMEDELDRN